MLIPELQEIHRLFAQMDILQQKLIKFWSRDTQICENVLGSGTPTPPGVEFWRTKIRFHCAGHRKKRAQQQRCRCAGSSLCNVKMQIQNKNKDFNFQRDGQLINLGDTNISYSPNVVAGSNLVFVPSTQFQIGLLSKYVGEQYMGNIDADLSKLSAYFINDLNLSYAVGPTTWAKGIDLSLLVNNIFNVQFESNGYFYTYDDTWSSPSQVTTIEGVGYYPQARINFLLGATIKL